MKNFNQSIRYLAIIGALYLFTTNITFGQSSINDGKFGLQFNGVVAFTEHHELDNLKLGYLGRAFLRYELSNSWETEIGAGYGIMKGSDHVENYETQLVPVDLRFLFRPFNSKSFNPYVYAGIGVLSYQVKDFPSIQRPDEEGNGWSAIIPIGVGYDFEIAEDISLDFNGNITYSFTDELNYLSEGVANDAYASLGLGIIFGSNSGSTDKDMDGLTKSEEELHGTDHEKSDSDGDGLKDGDEVSKHKTNPSKFDTDADGVSDGDEINKYLTDPKKADTDNDGISDKSEINDYKTDPTKADTDNDGLNDDEEINKYKTDPTKADTDSDNLQDGEELNKHKTDALNKDTDGDGLLDGEEVSKYKTNPLNIDSDAGSISDKIEVSRGTNPLSAEDDIVKIDVPMILEGVTFESGKSDITPESALILENALTTLQTYKDIFVEIRGYTDNVGRKASNIKLSQKRAESVRSWLVENGVDENRISAVGYGPENQIVPNDTPENKRKNRRIEFVRIK